MELDRMSMLIKTINTIKFLNNQTLIEVLKKTQLYYNKFLFFMNWNINNKKRSQIEEHNPVIWESVHPIFFMEKLCLRYLDQEHNYPYNSLFTNDVYDSFVFPLEERYRYNYPKFTQIKQYYNTINNKIISYIEQNTINGFEYYIIMLSIMHMHMHIESFIFTNQLVFKINPFNKLCDLIHNTNTIPLEEPEFIKIDGDSFFQGYFNTKKIGFDNEKPCFKKTIHDFSVSKTLITFYMFMKFFKDGGYNKDELWSFKGKIWKKNNKITTPLYWNSIKGNIFVDYFDTFIDIKQIYNYPIINISWYEAEAFCKWKNVRMITESEWEFLATNKSTTLYPWGDNEEKLSLCNINYRNNWVTDINYNCLETRNNYGVEQLVGNCWEWCQESIYPYDNFIIDPVYREMSYPFFGFKKICKGGAWCVPDFMITTSYRNAQDPGCRKQYIGFRCAKL